MSSLHRSPPSLRLVSTRERSAQRGEADPHRRVLLEACRGDARAVRTFLVTTAPAMLGVVRKMYGQGHPDEEDVLQECALAVVESLPSFRGECTVLHFVCRICVLTALQARRGRAALKRYGVIDADRDVDTVAGDARSIEDQLSERAAARALRSLLDELPEPQAEVLALHCGLGYTLSELEEATGAARETLRSRLRLAKKALRGKLLQQSVTRELLGAEQEEGG